MSKVIPEINLITATEPCPICFTNDLTGFVALDCDHTLCKDCFEEWHVKHKKNRCSLCRREIESIEIETGGTNDEDENTVDDNENRIQWFKFVCNAENCLVIIMSLASLFIASAISSRLYLELRNH